MPLIGIFGRFNGMRYVYVVGIRGGRDVILFVCQLLLQWNRSFRFLWFFNFVRRIWFCYEFCGREDRHRTEPDSGELCSLTDPRDWFRVTTSPHLTNDSMMAQDVNNARNLCHDSRNARIYRFWMLHLLELAGIKRQTSKLSCHARSRTERCWTCWWPAHIPRKLSQMRIEPFWTLKHDVTRCTTIVQILTRRTTTFKIAHIIRE